jgi:transcription initiation factor TFIIH subunit 1
MSNKGPEDVLHQIDHVRVRKIDGALYLMAERIAFMPNGKEQFTISHRYADIKTQKISPDGKPKIQLQLVLHNADSKESFQFVNPEGEKAQLEDRNMVS